MPARGKFIAIEGIDGSGKRTQIEMLANALHASGVEYTRVSFPHYDGFFGKMVAQFLNGQFGSLDAVDPHFSALLYAGDRLELKPQIEEALAAGKVVLADRYIGSNLAHQGSRAPRPKRAAFLKWLKQLEYEIYELPKEDLVVYLRVPARQAQHLVSKKGKRQYTKRRRDLQEASLAHLVAAAEVYDELATQPNWVRIECSDVVRHRIRRIQQKALRKINRASSVRNSAGAPLRSPQSIHEDVLAAVESRLLPQLNTKG
jgi:dTMP kinase